MIHQTALGKSKFSQLRALSFLINTGKVAYGGNKNLKIYGKLTCWRGKKMKVINRVFFASEAEALQAGFRPCAFCMLEAYKQYKNKIRFSGHVLP